jgi:hypothetical protein
VALPEIVEFRIVADPTSRPAPFELDPSVRFPEIVELSIVVVEPFAETPPPGLLGSLV